VDLLYVAVALGSFALLALVVRLAPDR